LNKHTAIKLASESERMPYMTIAQAQRFVRKYHRWAERRGLPHDSAFALYKNKRKL